ncbi:hypothetical protein ALC60_00278, partial [Trachymyrmex zeteki]
RSRWDIIQFYEPLLLPLRLRYLYKSAAHVFCSPLRQVEDGLTRNYLLSKFLRGKLPLPQRWDM